MIIIIDFGSQFTQLIARCVRNLGVYSEIIPFRDKKKISKLLNSTQGEMEGLIFSGGPFSVYKKNSPNFSFDIESINVPILGVCYGFQLINFMLGGKVIPSKKHEYGFEKILLTFRETITKENPMHALMETKLTEHIVWMSHGDEIKTLSPQLIADSKTRNGVFASFHHKTKPIFGVQFHPEVHHTECGQIILKHFVENTCQCKKNWEPQIQIESIVNSIKNKLNFHFIDKKNSRACPNSQRAICALSGGVDSCVAAILASKVFGDRLHCIFINNGLLRKNEFKETIENFKKYLDLNVKGVDASKLFLSRLSNIKDSEEKRKIIGNTFIEVFEKEAENISNVKFLVQGTLYPDVIESIPLHGSSSVIKTHHNVGGLPKNMKFVLIEPLRELFKDEVRQIGQRLQIPDKFLKRHPFPGPGLAIRILGEVTKEKLATLQNADAILIDELKKQKLYDLIWQAFAVLLPISSVGVMGDARTYENVIAIRCVSSIDGMTADWSRLPHEFLASVSSRITNEVKGINRVVYDISSKPPATIEWE